MRQRNFVLVFSTDRKVVHNQKIVKPYKSKVNDPAVNTAYTFLNPLTNQIDFGLEQNVLTEFNKNYKSRSCFAPERIKNEVSYITQGKLNEIKSFKRRMDVLKEEYLELFDRKVIEKQSSLYTKVKEFVL